MNKIENVNMKKCEICGIEEAIFPDRNRQGRPIKRICKKCHISRLYDDLKFIKRSINDRI
jgi:hypothetical protein